MEVSNLKSLDICVVGLGYIGLPSASLLATKGHRVYGFDINNDIVETINKGQVHITEPGLNILVKAAVMSRNLLASTQPNYADVFIISVPTPLKTGSEDIRMPDLSYLEYATQSITPYIKPGNLVIIESTIPVGTTDGLIARMLKESGFVFEGDNAIYLAHCPERVLPGQIIKELIENNRVVGGINNTSTEKATKFYKSFVNGKVFSTTAKTAEMVKLTENSFRDVNIAFANELSIICDKNGLNVWELISLSNQHPRVNILNPGPGVGGHCIAVDPWFIVAGNPNEAKLIRSAREINDSKPYFIAKKVIKAAERILNEKNRKATVACLGLTYKADIDDTRESPALVIASILRKETSIHLIVSDPYLGSAFQEFDLCPVDEAVRLADIILLLVEHKEFTKINTKQLANKEVFDTRGFWNK